MAKDSLEISSHFGIYPLEQSIALRGDKFKKKYSSSDNMSADSQTLVHVLVFPSFTFFFVDVLYLLMYFVAYFDATIKLV